MRAAHAERRGRRCDVAPEARVAVEQRVAEERIARALQERRGRRAVVRQRAAGIDEPSDLGGTLACRQRAVRQRRQVLGDAVHQAVPEAPELLGVEGQRHSFAWGHGCSLS